jgi:hypothetical protein
LETVSWIFHAFWIQTFFPFKHLVWKVMQAHMGVIRPHYILRSCQQQWKLVRPY